MEQRSSTEHVYDASNRTKRYGYDVLGCLRHVIDYAGQTTRFDYDGGHKGVRAKY